MTDTSNNLEAIRLVSDWGKWLVTIETAAIAIIGAFLADDRTQVPELAKVLGTLAIGSFLLSIAGAAILLLTLPEIAQNLRADQNIWLTRDSVAGKVLRANTQGLALLESIFFGFGVVLFVGMIVAVIWS
jgi:uncharacterized membrane protein YeaQ/YmgE (transglycosylase-associated protein family)